VNIAINLRIGRAVAQASQRGGPGSRLDQSKWVEFVMDSGTGTCSSPSSSVLPCQYQPTVVLHTHNRRVDGRSSETQSRPIDMNNHLSIPYKAGIYRPTEETNSFSSTALLHEVTRNNCIIITGGLFSLQLWLMKQRQLSSRPGYA
jgi:hypothetical protein